MEKTSVLAITKNGVNIGEKLKRIFSDYNIFAPSKLTNQAVGSNSGILILHQKK